MYTLSGDEDIGPKLMVDGFGRHAFAKCGVDHAKQEGAYVGVHSKSITQIMWEHLKTFNGKCGYSLAAKIPWSPKKHKVQTWKSPYPLHIEVDLNNYISS